MEKSTTVVSSFTADPDLDWFRKNVYRAQAVLIIPQNLKGAFLVGGAGGSGVLLARDIKTGQWSYPAFYTLGSLSIGLQAGAESSEIILMVMTERGMESMLTSSFKLGADVTLAAGPVGVGAKAKTADIISYARAKGVFAGVSLDGAVVKTRDGLNGAYYGRKVSPTDILIRRDAVNGHADKLRAAVKAVAK
ncbi:lipid-binding SYLF domain-containing protein [Desulfosediminicola ganghwensis]|uniref:lipid-binding SYLF domain-containing protein n=1 Tax=Desulfosediminicola ganghwensis TaxID=2569540 RepID=UPI001E34413E|nr:lipid-binding SYLF domain-containing protein [Desulfosediminicola ganghwensis]